uniref:Dynein regulatory complex protein 1 n=1 Tax=Cuerna arida TaxID=1464854 RepID=A0A1B6H2U9_9HEMI
MDRHLSKLSRSDTQKTVDNEPQITSPYREERIMARRLRVQKRNAAAKKRLMQSDDVGKESSSEKEETVLEQQVEKSTVELLTLTHEGKELISNVRVAADAHEVKRRADQAAAKEARIKKLEEEANLAQQKFNQINSKWESITLLNDPLDLHQETERQREKCVDLITQKDKLIEELKAELKAGDVRFVKDQQKQAEDIALLVERIDNQITIMRRAYRRELVLIENAIDIEREETMDINNTRWQALYKQREDNEIFNLEQRFVALSEHNQLMQNIMVHHQEKFRATKISLEKDIQVLQQQLEQVKAICLLNKEKMEYNYQVLKKRDEESLLIRSQQKRRINKLQDIVTTLRRKLMQMEQSTQAEVKRLTSEVIKLHRNIKDIQLKAEHFCSVNETKYFQLWKFNHDSAQKLLDKICSIDRLVHEQQLGIKWRPVGSVSLTRQNLPSYKAAIEKRNSGALQEEKLQGHLGSTDNERLLQHILEAVADRSGFLVEDRLTVLLAPYTRSQNTLVRIDNVFSALGVTRPEDIELLRQTMEPYIVCVTCQPLLEAVHPVSPPASPPPPTPTEDELKVRVMKKFEDTLEEGERITLKRKEKSEEDILSPDGQKVSTMTGDSVSVTPWVTLSAVEIPDQSFTSIFPTSVHNTKSVAPSMYTLVVSRRPEAITQSHEQVSVSDVSQIESSVPDAPTEPDQDVTSKDQEVTFKEPHDPRHVFSINPVYVLKALREFVVKFQALKHCSRCKWSSPVGKEEVTKSISRQITDSDVRDYWEQFRNAFPPEREKLWDCLYMGLQKYHTILQERHRINNEIEQLKVQNAELRRLLQKYALPNNMKPTKGSRQNLPPLSLKTPPAPAPTPARLLLTFNNTSRM